MTRLLVFSDLHLETNPDWNFHDTELPAFDIAVVAGDVDRSIARSIRTLASHPRLRSQPIVYVAGNHDYYHGEIAENEREGRVAARETGVHFLQKDTVIINDIAFIGATLWTDYAVHGTRNVSMAYANLIMNDHSYISMATETGEEIFTPANAAAIHDEHRQFIKSALRGKKSKTVVVTHHLPSASSIAPRFRSLDNGAFASNLDELILDHKPDIWIHGHTHNSFAYRIGKTRVICNPHGYGPYIGRNMPEENPNFDPGLLIDI